ncbi:MAG: hypothetical protein K2J08_03850 [Ruminococcus sp.]|nr:hypothetical protein [Ruminococcus sp.]
MQGTGTKTDPYIVDNWSDYQALSGSSIYIEWDNSAECKIVDFNEINPSGFDETVNFSRYTTFNGWSFVNFFSTAKNNAISISDVSSTTGNFKFVNFYWQPDANTSSTKYSFIKSSATSSTVLKNCEFSGRIEIVTGKKNFSSDCVKLNECSLNLVLNTTENFTVFANTIKNSDVILDVSAPSLTLCEKEAINSRFSGKIRSQNVVNVGTENSGYNVYNLDSDGPLNYQGKGVSVYNSEISASSQTDEEMEELGIKFEPCTAEELKNTTYLQGVNFPIGVD